MLGQIGAGFLAENGQVTFDEVSITKPDGRRRIEGRVIGTRLALAWPEGGPHPHVRRVALACSSATPCSLVLDTADRPSVGGNP